MRLENCMRFRKIVGNSKIVGILNNSRQNGHLQAKWAFVGKQQAGWIIVGKMENSRQNGKTVFEKPSKKPGTIKKVTIQLVKILTKII